MTILRLALALVLALFVILYVTRPAEPVADLNVIAYDGKTLSLNGRSTTEEKLRAMEFPPDSEIMIKLTDARQTSFGSTAGLIHNWNQKGIEHYFTLDGVPLRTDTITWRDATQKELQEEIEAENVRRERAAELQRLRKEQRSASVDPTTEDGETPEEAEDDSSPYQPEDTNRYYWNDKLIGTAAQAEQRFRQTRFTSPGALLVITPKSDAPPAGATGIDTLGFSPEVTELLKRAREAGVVVRLHPGEGYKPPQPSRSAAGLFGGFFYTYLGPLVLTVGAIFLVSWFLEGGRAQRES